MSNRNLRYTFNNQLSFHQETVLNHSNNQISTIKTNEQNEISLETDSYQNQEKEMKLWETTKERQIYENLADLYAIIKTTEHLETAYVRDAITPEQYTETCMKLISQFKTAETALIGTNIFTNTENFIATYRMDCPRAFERLVRLGVPATFIHNTSNGKGDSILVAQTVQHFITIMDSLKLNVRAIDELQPLISELLASLTQVNGVSPSFDGKIKIETWLRIMNTMKASDELTDEQVRELNFELEKAYTSFMSFLNKK